MGWWIERAWKSDKSPMPTFEAIDDRSYRSITPHELELVFKKHKAALAGEKAGVIAKLEGSVLRDAPLNNYALDRAQFVRCDLRGFTFKNISLRGTRFEGCDLREATFDGVLFEDTHFNGGTWLDGSRIMAKGIRSLTFLNAHIDSLTFLDCSFDESGGLSFAGCEGRQILCQGLQLRGLTLRASRIVNGEFQQIIVDRLEIDDHCDLDGVSLDGARLGAMLVNNIVARNCKWRGIRFQRDCQVDQSSLLACDFAGTDFSDCFMRRSTIDGSSFTRCKHLHGRHGLSVEGLRGAEKACYSHPWDFCSWSLVRVVGALPLFGASYVGIVAIITWSFIVQWYNGQIYQFKEMHPSIEKTPVIDYLRTLPVSREMGLMLVALFLLAIGATMYRLLCPEIVAEYTENQWTNELRHERFTYRVHAFRRPIARWLCGLLIVSGGSWVLIHLVVSGAPRDSSSLARAAVWHWRSPAAV